MWLRGLSIAQPHVWDRCCLNPNARSRQRAGWETGVCVSVRQTVHSTVTERSELVERLRYRKSGRRGPGRTCGWHAEGWRHLPGVSRGKAGSLKSMAQKFEYMLGLILRDGTDKVSDGRRGENRGRRRSCKVLNRSEWQGLAVETIPQLSLTPAEWRQRSRRVRELCFIQTFMRSPSFKHPP